jgi:hypothetical protein
VNGKRRFMLGVIRPANFRDFDHETVNRRKGGLRGANWQLIRGGFAAGRRRETQAKTMA